MGVKNVNKVYVTPRSITQNHGHPALKKLEDAGLDIILSSPGKQPSEEEQLKTLPECVAYLAGIEPITDRVMSAAKSLKIISRNGVGIENIDLESAKRHDIEVKIAPGSNARGVAELAIALMLSAVRFIPYCNEKFKKGEWKRNMGMEIEKKTLGIIGCGNIGKTVARLALGLEMRVLGYDLYPDLSFQPSKNFSHASLKEVIQQSDIITLHVPPSENPIIDEEAIKLMKQGVYIINTARAGVVDKKAVLNGLNSNKILVYATDVFETEPPVIDELLSHERVITTPHVGGYTQESIDSAVEMAVDNILKALNLQSLIIEHHPIESMEKELNEKSIGNQVIELIWLGQAGFVLKYEGKEIIIDPYLSDFLARKYAGKTFPHARLMPIPVNPDNLLHVDYIFSSHPHSDHLDPDTITPISRNNPNCKFIVPSAAFEEAISRGIDKEQIIPVNAGDSIQLTQNIKIKPIPASHETLEVNQKGEHLFLGYIFQLGDIAIYHSGDCIPYDGLTDYLKAEKIHLALLPINGRDDYRLKNGIAGNFKIPEVLDICEAAGIKNIIVHHFGMFSYNTVSDAELIDLENRSSKKLRIIIPKINWLYKIQLS